MKILFADAETTGLDAKVNEITQFGGIITIDGKTVEEINIFLRPTDFKHISQDALDITKKTVADLVGYPPAAEGYQKLLGILGKYVNKFDRKDKFVWVGQNARFDVDFVRALFERQGDKDFGSWFGQPVDLISIARFCEMSGLIQLKDCKLGTICSALNIEFNPHGAMEDIKATQKALYKMAGFLVRPIGV